MSKFSDQIIDKVKTTKPYPKIYFQLLTLIAILVMVGIVVTAITTTTLNFWDFFRFVNSRETGANPRQLVGESIWSILFVVTVEIVAVLFFSIGIFYFLYRKTNWFLVKNRFILILGILLIIIIGGVVGVLVIENHRPTQKYFDVLEKRLETFGRRREKFLERREMIRRRFDEAN
jgi:hypothetical protein